MRVAASFNKLPGFFRISGYEQAARMAPQILLPYSQYAHLVDRVSKTYPELGEIRKKVLSENE
jgi:hypothetical protein